MSPINREAICSSVASCAFPLGTCMLYLNNQTISFCYPVSTRVGLFPLAPPHFLYLINVFIRDLSVGSNRDALKLV